MTFAFPTRRASLGLILSALAGCTVKPRKTSVAPPFAPQPLRRATRAWPSLDAMAQAMVDDHFTPGLSISVMRDGVLLYSRGFGRADLTTAAAIAPQSRFRVASITKQFTAAAILLLQEQGLLTVDDPLARFLPDMRRAQDITLREMLSHTSGMGDYLNGQSPDILVEAQRRDYSSDELLGIVEATTPMSFQPGTRWFYSNSAFALLGLIVEQLTGMAYGAFCRQHLFQPAGLGHTSIDSVAAVPADACRGYRSVSRGAGTFGEVLPISPSFAGGAGAIRSTTEDLCRWHHALMGGGILKPASLVEMLTPATFKDGLPAHQRNGEEVQAYGFGQGLGMSGAHPYFVHGGRLNGFTSHLRSFPVDGVTVACLYNCDGSGTADYLPTQRRLRNEAARLGLADRQAL